MSGVDPFNDPDGRGKNPELYGTSAMDTGKMDKMVKELRDQERIDTEITGQPKEYYGTKRIFAWPEQRPMIHTDSEGEPKDGYAVRYEDGYTSWSPKDTFEAAYQPVTAMSFGHAITALKEGHVVCRAGWNGKGMWLSLRREEPQKRKLAYIMMKTAQGDLVPWLASQTDMLADDWALHRDMLAL